MCLLWQTKKVLIVLQDEVSLAENCSLRNLMTHLTKTQRLLLNALLSAPLFFALSLFAVPSYGAAQAVPTKPIKIQSLYGNIQINDNFIKALITHPALKRLRNIDSAGPGRYFRSMPAYSLFDHALGVFVFSYTSA